MQIDTAFILAAGLGTRMRPLTLQIPKPLIKVNGISFIDRIITHLNNYGIKNIIVNASYKHDQITEHVKQYSNVQVSYEDTPLETGGGLSKALPLIGNKPFFCITSDIIWDCNLQNPLSLLAGNYKPSSYGLLALKHTEHAFGYYGEGDFKLHKNQLQFASPAPYVFAGLQILNPKVFDLEYTKSLGKKFALNKLYRQFTNKFNGIEFIGNWYHIGDVKAKERYERLY